MCHALDSKRGRRSGPGTVSRARSRSPDTSRSPTNRPVRRWSSWCHQPWTQTPPTPGSGWRIRVGRTGLHTPVGRSSLADALEDVRGGDRGVLEPDLVRAGGCTRHRGSASMRDARRRSGWLCGSYVGRKRCRTRSRPGPVEVEPEPKSGPANKTRRSGETASSRRRTIKPPDRSKQAPAPGSPDVPQLATS